VLVLPTVPTEMPSPAAIVNDAPPSDIHADPLDRHREIADPLPTVQEPAVAASVTTTVPPDHDAAAGSVATVKLAIFLGARSMLCATRARVERRRRRESFIE